jgi:hypothetical protein
MTDSPTARRQWPAALEEGRAVTLRCQLLSPEGFSMPNELAQRIGALSTQYFRSCLSRIVLGSKPAILLGHDRTFCVELRF